MACMLDEFCAETRATLEDDPLAEALPQIADTPRLSLSTTVIENTHGQCDLAAEINSYDRRRAASRLHRRQRDPERWGEAQLYGWSEDKTRQHSVPTLCDFDSFARGKRFCLD